MNSDCYQRQRKLSTTQSTSAPMARCSDEIALKRSLNLWSGICFIVGITIGKQNICTQVVFISIINIFRIGSGIFVSPKGALKYTESVGLCLTVWTLSGLVALFG